MVDLLNHSIQVVLILSIVPILAVGLAGGAVAVIQAATQVQEASMVHLARLAAVAVVLFIFGSTGYGILEELFVRGVELSGGL